MISIIIPIYNTPIQYLTRCIASIQKQDYTDWEIIIVNDGSNKETKADIEELQELCDNIRVIHQVNKGVSAARNIGIKNAKGDYFVFIDGDDTVKPNYFQEAYDIITKYDACLVIGTIEYCPGDTILQGVTQETIFRNEEINDVKKALLKIPQSKIPYPILGTPCARLIKRKLALDSEFPVGVTYKEDQIFNRLLLNNAKTVVIVPNLWYTYFQNDFSAMHTQNLITDMKRYELELMFVKVWFELDKKETDLEIRKEEFMRTLHIYCVTVRHWGVKIKKKNLLQKRRWLENIYDDIIDESILSSISFADSNRFSEIVMLFTVKHKILWFIYAVQWIKHRLEKRVKSNENDDI
ncbi:Glycosyl transferase family 2 [anaerobic digester metagenome]